MPRSSRLRHYREIRNGRKEVLERSISTRLMLMTVSTNRELLLQALGDEAFWRGEHHVGTLANVMSGDADQ